MNRPRLKAAASSSASPAGRRAWAPPAGSDVPVTIPRPSVEVMISGMDPCALPVLHSFMTRACRSHDSEITAAPPATPNRAVERPPSIAHDHVPGVCGASRQSAGAGGGTGAGGAGGGGATRGGGAGAGGGTASQPATNRNVRATRARFAFIPPVWNEPLPRHNPARHMADRPVPPSVANLAAAKKAPKQRIDQLLVERGLAESRTRAAALILAGHVFTGETKLAKPGQTLPADAPLALRGRDHPWVSRGGIKLAHAIEHFALSPAGVTAMDIGSSTGGFTDVLLTNGAAHVFAVDSGTNQLAWKLRQDPRVTVLEQTSARLLTPALITAPCTWVVCDASFISLAKVLAVPLSLAAPGCTLVALIKPQFEVGRGEVGKGGVVRDPALHARVCEEVRQWLETAGWTVHGITESPIKGPEGNVEFLIYAVR